MPVKLGNTPHGFDEPLGVLCDCHRQIEHHLEVLVLLSDTVRGGPLSPSHRHALQGALDYFLHHAPCHRQDEEQSLFPRLAQSPDRRACELRDTLQGLLEDHVAADAHHATVNALVQQWLAAGELPTPEAERLNDTLAWLHAMYQRHIAVEGSSVFRTAGECLRRQDLHQIGQEMAARRQPVPQA